MSKNFGYYKQQINDNKTTINNHEQLFNSIFDKIYPVGTLYWSSNSTNPATLFGIGTWTQIKDKFIYAAGSKAVNTAGGAETHTLTINEMPSHNHTANNAGAHTHTLSVDVKGNPDGWADYGRNYWNNNWASMNPSTSSAGDHTHSINSAGGSGAHNNMPPYIVKYCWERTS